MPVIRANWERETTGVWLRKSEREFVPWNEEAAGQLMALKVGALGVGDIGSKRNPKQLALYWVLINFVAAARDVTPRRVHAGLKAELLEPDVFVDIFGNAHVEYPSIALTAMPQAEFSQFFSIAINLMSNDMSVAPKELRNAFFDTLEPGLKDMMRNI